MDGREPNLAKSFVCRAKVDIKIWVGGSYLADSQTELFTIWVARNNLGAV